jgi:hypothetical protein
MRGEYIIALSEFTKVLAKDSYKKELSKGVIL